MWMTDRRFFAEPMPGIEALESVQIAISVPAVRRRPLARGLVARPAKCVPGRPPGAGVVIAGGRCLQGGDDVGVAGHQREHPAGDELAIGLGSSLSRSSSAGTAHRSSGASAVTIS